MSDNVPSKSDSEVERLLRPFRDGPPSGEWRVLFRDPETGNLVDRDGTVVDPKDVSPLVSIYDGDQM